MSEFDQTRSNSGSDEGDNVEYCPKDDRENAHKKSSRKWKRAPLFRLPKLHRKNKLPSYSTSLSCCLIGKRENVEGEGCLMCFKTSPIDDSPVHSDPNSPRFTFELVRDLIEKNDFFCKECSTHFDVEATSKSCKV